MPLPSPIVLPSPQLLPGGPSTTVAIAKYKIEVAWGSRIAGIFQLDSSTLDGSDTLATDSWSQTFAGPYDDITADVRQLDWTRGKSDDLSQVQAMSLTVTLHDKDGRYNPKNPASPLAGQLRAMRPIRITAYYGGGTEAQCYGFLRTIDFEPGGRSHMAKLEASDLFLWMENPRVDDSGAPLPVIARMNNTTTGAAIGALLDWMGWRDATMRSLDVGDSIPYFEALGDKTPLQHISELLDANRGVFYIDKAGRAVFEDRNTRGRRVALYAVYNTMTAIATGSSLDRVRNRWTVTRAAGAPQVWQDAASEHEFGERDDSVTTIYLTRDDDALNLAQFLVARTKDPLSPLWTLTIDNRQEDLLLTILRLELQQKIVVIEAQTGASGTFYVEQLQHQLSADGRRHTCSLVLSEVESNPPFTLDDPVFGRLDGAGVIVY